MALAIALAITVSAALVLDRTATEPIEDFLAWGPSPRADIAAGALLVMTSGLVGLVGLLIF